jgi:two-component system nitrate/nitrite response regulator NarL
MESPLRVAPSSAPGGASLGDASEPTGGFGEEPHPEPAIEVLLISDMLLMRVSLRHMLESAATMRVAEASSCEEARALASRDPPDVIVLDLDAQPDRLACLEDLIAIRPDSRVIALSDRTKAAEHSTLVERGALGLVLKHEHPQVLVKAIKKVCAGEVWLDRSNTARILSGIARRRRTEDIETAKIAALTRRERQIIELVGEGLKNGVIAQRLFICEATVRNHLTSILDKLGLSDRFELAVYAFRNGLVQYPAAPETNKRKQA